MFKKVRKYSALVEEWKRVVNQRSETKRKNTKEIALVHTIKTIDEINDDDIACFICKDEKKDITDNTMKFVTFKCCPKISWCRSCYFSSRDFNTLYCICESPLQNDLHF